MSPNVVIDIVLWLKIEKLGLYKGIHTIIIAVTTINDVLSIFCFNVVLGVIFSTGKTMKRFGLTQINLWISCHFSCEFSDFRFWFWTGSLQQQLLQGPVGIAIGIVYGFVYGLAVSKVLPFEKSVNNISTVVNERAGTHSLVSWPQGLVKPMSIVRLNLVSVFVCLPQNFRNMRTVFVSQWWYWVVWCQSSVVELLDIRQPVR